MSGFYDAHHPHHPQQEQQQSYSHTFQDLQDIPEDAQPVAPPFFDIGVAAHGSSQLSPTSMSQYFEQSISESPSSETKPPTKPRRRHPPGSDHCDETRPICERCKKGSRECTWPDPSSSSKSASGSKASQQKRTEGESSSSSDELEDDQTGTTLDLDTEEMPGIDEGATRSPVAGPKTSSKRHRKQSGGSPQSRLKEKSLSPSTDESKSQSDASVFSSKFSSASLSTVQDDPHYARLKPDLCFYVDYHTRHVDYHQYFFKQDPTHFFHIDLLKAALAYEPLLYALVGFSAFHYALAQPDGKLSNFLGYYNKSVSLLRKDLASEKGHTDLTILTILQLATFEEYLGDWVNLMGHQKAAYGMITELHTPESIVKTDFHRKILTWYSRFDIYAGLMAGAETILGKEWFSAIANYTQELAMLNPNDLGIGIESMYAQLRVLGFEMTQLIAKIPKIHKGELSLDDWAKEDECFLKNLANWRAQANSYRANTEYVMPTFEDSPQADPEAIVAPYKPDSLFKEPFFAFNYMMTDGLGAEASYRYQVSLMFEQPQPPELLELSLGAAAMFEAIELWHGSPPGAIFPIQATLGLLCLILPREAKYVKWCRKKLVTFESLGYVYPPMLRLKLAEQWGDSSIKEWWLPDGEGQPPLIRSIRSFIEERTVKPQNQAGEDIRAMKAMLSKMSLNDSPKDSPESSESMQDSITYPDIDTGVPAGFEVTSSQPQFIPNAIAGKEEHFASGVGEPMMEAWMSRWNPPPDH